MDALLNAWTLFFLQDQHQNQNQDNVLLQYDNLLAPESDHALVMSQNVRVLRNVALMDALQHARILFLGLYLLQNQNNAACALVVAIRVLLTRTAVDVEPLACVQKSLAI